MFYLKKKWITTLCIICTVGLIGCQGKIADEKKQQQQIQASEQKADDVKKPVTLQQAEPVVVEIEDPTTKAIIQTIAPKEMDYERDRQSYTEQIKQLAKDLARGNKKNNRL